MSAYGKVLRDLAEPGIIKRRIIIRLGEVAKHFAFFRLDI